jgi:ADP-ribose pyrophosphatase
MANKEYPDAPRVATGAVVLHNDKVLLVLRGQPPAANMWAIPGGSVELGETVQSAAEREVREETGLIVTAGEVIYTFDAIYRDKDGRVRYHYVILDVLATAANPNQPLVPADDVRDARWFSLANVNDPALAVSDTTRALLNRVMKATHD